MQNPSSLIHAVENSRGRWLFPLKTEVLAIASKPVTKLQILHVTLLFWFEKSLCARRETGLKASKAKVRVSCCIELSAKDLGTQAVIATSTEKDKQKQLLICRHRLNWKARRNTTKATCDLVLEVGLHACRPHRLSNST